MEDEEKFSEVLSDELKVGEWTLWEHYDEIKSEVDNTQKTSKQDLSTYKSNSQKVAWFNDIISFWQVWQNLPFRDLKKFFINMPNQSAP